MIKLHFDGASRGNPGPSGCGWIIEMSCPDKPDNSDKPDKPDNSDNFKLESGCMFLGTYKTNNYAEYRGLVNGLEQIKDYLEFTELLGITYKKLEIYGDSLLVIKQMRGEYKVKSEILMESYIQAKRIVRSLDIEEITFTHIPGPKNYLADKQANIAIDKELIDN
jgi:ribonuclease HI